MSHDELVIAVLGLSRPERAALARQLLRSLDGTAFENEPDEMWLEQAELRLDQVLNGEVAPILGVDAMRQVRRTLG